MKAQYGYVPLAFAISLGLTSCGGEAGGSIGDFTGIGGTGIIAEGTISSFGSIFVNGTRFELPESAVITVDDDPTSSESDLKLGMVVRIVGTLTDDSGQHARARSVLYDNEVEGPISDVRVLPGTDGAIKVLTILGVPVIVERDVTVFDDPNHNNTFETLAVGQVVETCGFRTLNNAVQATRVEWKGLFDPATTEIRMKGDITNFNAAQQSFQIGSQLIRLDRDTHLSELDAGLANGLFVEVQGSVRKDGTVRAKQIRAKQKGLQDQPHASLEGIVTDFNGAADFLLNGRQRVNASDASYLPAGLTLANGMEIEVEGPVINGILQATKVESRSHSIQLEATVTGVDRANERVTLQAFGAEFNVIFNAMTRLEDKLTASNRRTEFLNNLQAGDFLEVRGFLAAPNSNEIIAIRIEKDKPEDVRLLQAPLQQMDAVNQSITLLGATLFTHHETTFENSRDDALGAAAFFNTASIGALVKVKDELDKGQPGFADEVELEDD